MSVLSISLLGTFDGTLDREPLSSFRSNKARALLTYLTVEVKQAHVRAHICSLFWPESSDAQAQNSLRVGLRQVRVAIKDQESDPPFLLINRQTIYRNPAAEIYIDVEQFEQLAYQKNSASRRQAIKLYRGDFLMGQAFPDCPEFEAWLLLKREYYARMALTVLDDETNHCLAAQQFEDAQIFARRQLELDEWRESAHRQLMQALDASGERNAALAQYERCKTLLWEDLGVEPEEATRELAEAMRQSQATLSASDAPGNQDASLSGAADVSASATAEIADAEATEQGRPLIFQDRGEMPVTEWVYGREAEVEQLIDWIEIEGVQLAAILGIGGQGKTTLAASYVRSLLEQPQQQPFDFVIWRSLLNAPPLMEVLQSWLGLLVDESETEMPQSLDDSLGLLFQFLRERRVLLVLDNAESILASGETAGSYLLGYEAYGQLLERMGGSEHQSCLLITSRERLPQLARMERRTAVVRALQLNGLSAEATAELLKSLSLEPEGRGWHELVDRFSGNPLALLMVADTIDGLFDGDIDAFLTDAFLTNGGLIFDDVRDVLNEQFTRLTELERTILTWIAIERGAITAAELRRKILQIGSQRTFLEALRSLQRRSLLVQRRDGQKQDNQKQDGQRQSNQPQGDQGQNRRSDQAGQPNRYQSDHTHPQLRSSLAQPSDMLTMQNVIIEFTTDLLIESICREFAQQKYSLLRSHALLNAQSKEYVRSSQQRLILGPLAQRLVEEIGADEITKRVPHLLSELRQDETHRKSYAAGNLLNILLQIGLSLDGVDLAGFTIRHPFLRGHNVRNVNFSKAEFISAVFTDTFSNARQVAFSPDGHYLAAVTSGSGEIRIWDGNGREPIASLSGHSKLIYSLSWHQNGHIFATGGEDGSVRLWERKTLRATDSQASGQWHGRLLYQDSDIVRAVAFRAIGEPKAADSPKAAENPGLPTANSIVNSIVATAGDDPRIRLWSVATRKIIITLKGHTRVVTDLSFSPDGLLLASCSADGSIRLWKLSKEMNELQEESDVESRILLQLPEDALEVWTVQFSPDGTRLAAGSLDGTVWIWSVRQLREKGWANDSPIAPTLTLKEHQQSVQQIAFSPNGKVLASGGDDRLIRLWDTETGSILNTLQGHDDTVLTVAIRSDGQVLASASLDGTLRFWDIETGLPEQTLTAYSKPFNSVSFGSTPQLLVTASGDDIVRVWQGSSAGPQNEGADDSAASLQTITCRHEFPVHHGMIWDVVVSPDDRLAASVSEDMTVALWDLEHGRLRGQLTGHIHIITSVVFSPDGRLVASGSIDQTCRLWDANTGDAVATFDDGSGVYDVHNAIWSIAFSPDGQSIAAGFGQGNILIWDVATGKIQQVLQSHTEWVRGLVFSPDGKTLFSSSNDQSIRVWSLGSGEVVQQLDGHTDWVMTLALSPNGKILASAGHDQTIRLWAIDDSQSVTLLDTLTDHTGSILAVDFSADGRYLASASSDESIKLWDIAERKRVHELRTAGPYQGTNIAGATGLTDAQRATLRKLGAVG